MSTLNKHISNGIIIKRRYQNIRKSHILKDFKIAEDISTGYGNDKTVINLYLNADLLNIINR